MAEMKTVHVTPAQKQAAKALVNRSAKTGRSVSWSVLKIANAKSTGRSALSQPSSNGSTALHAP